MVQLTIKTDEKDFLKFEEKLLKKIIESRGNNQYVLSHLSQTLTKLKKFKDALRIDQKLIKLHPDNPVFRYNMACDYALLGKFEYSLQELNKAIRFGFRDFNYIFVDKDLEQLVNKHKQEIQAIIDKFKEVKQD
ncbi:MAG: hypothetical protein HY606_14110 [Planctomycetes bacterium]|nr:hypothetical protein [Planctomycetota bacterium]